MVANKHGASGRSMLSAIFISGITMIYFVSFFGCTSLERLVIHSSMTSIGAGAFSECTGLASLEILTENASIGSNAFPEHLTVAYGGGVYIGNTENPYWILMLLG